MSIRALNAARGLGRPGDLSASARLVLWALADRANDDGECWPGLERVAEDCGMSVAQAARHIAQLGKLKLVESTRRWRPDGARRSNLYRLRLPGLSEKSKPVDITAQKCAVTKRAETPKLTTQKCAGAPAESARLHDDESPIEPSGEPSAYPEGPDSSLARGGQGENTGQALRSRAEGQTEAPKSEEAIGLLRALYGRDGELDALCIEARRFLPSIYNLVGKLNRGELPFAWGRVLEIAGDVREDHRAGKVGHRGPAFVVLVAREIEKAKKTTAAAEAAG